MKTAVLNCIVVLASTVFALLASEGIARLILNPADYLGVGMVNDHILGAVPEGHPHGFDAWGFRNPAVPQTADIVAIGDSHTYGNTARMEDSWPIVLGKLTGRSVYNMGMGGYGPNQYDYLLKARALSLKPKIVICGLYLGDDFENAYTITYGLPYWSYLRDTGIGKADYNIWDTAPTPSWQKQIRIWLSRNSVIYQIVLHASFIGQAQGEAQIRNATALNSAATAVSVPSENILEAFLPESILARVDQANPNVREGMRITFALLKDMHDTCERRGIRFIVAVIPTKELVLAKYVEHKPELHLSSVLDQVLVNERSALDTTFAFLSQNKIEYVNTLPALQASASQQLYARTAADMHPGKNGYHVIADAVYRSLN